MSQDVLHVEDQMRKKEEEFHGKDDHLGLTLMTFPQYISATRSTMFTNHLKQFNTLNEGEFPHVFTGYENIFGKNSSSLVVAKADYEVIAKIQKFEDYPNYLYALILYNEKEDKYDILFKRISENLTEKFGYTYNNESLDRLEVGDTISEGEVLYKSASYDENNNYCYGLNANTAYLLDPGNVEDAYVISESFAKRMVSRKVDVVKISLNDNDFLINIYGDTKRYKGFPDIGENIERHMIAAKRRIINDQILFDMKKANMMKVNELSDKVYSAKGFVTDIDIYCNKPIEEIKDTEFNAQLLYYLKNQQRYFKELFDECDKIIKSGSKYSHDIGFIHARSRNILDPNYQWKDNQNVFSNMIIEIRVDRDIAIYAGSKITGRYGDKGVVSDIRPDSEMPYFYNESGEKVIVDVLANPLSCPNRLNPFQWIEIELNHDACILVERLKLMESNDERWKTLKQFLKFFDERKFLTQLTEYYTGLDADEQNEFWESVYKDGIFINYPPMWEDMPALDKLDELNKKYSFPRHQLYIHKFGREIKIMRETMVGYKFMIKLKQDSEKNFSARATGSLSQQGLPEKSNKVRTNEMLYSNTPITLGRDENNNLGAGVETFMLCKMHLMYRNSPFARRALGKKLYGKRNPLKMKKFEIKEGYLNRNVEILNAELKSLGAYIDFGFNGITLNVKDDTVYEFEWRGKTYLATKEEMREVLLDDLLRWNFNKKKHKTKNKKKLEAEYQEFKERAINDARGVLTVDIDEEKFNQK